MKFVLIFLLATLNLSAHPVHLSVTNIEYDSKNKEFDISIRLFVDDFETILNKNYNAVLNIGKKNENPKTKTYINDYIKKNLQININDENITKDKLNLKKREIKDLTIWLTYKIPYKKDFNNCTITNTLMYDLYPDQKNMLIFTINNKQLAFEFYKKNPIQNIKL